MMTTSLGESQPQTRTPTFRIVAVSVTLVLLLAGFFVLSKTGILSPAGEQDQQDSPMNQAAVLPDTTPSFTVEAPPSVWLQAFGSSSGNSAWAPAVTAPFDTLWTLSTGREIFSPPAVMGDHIYIAGNDKVLRALNRHTGAQSWSRTVTCGVSGGVAADSTMVFFSGQDGYLYGINRATGSEEWRAGLGYHIFTDACIFADSLVLAGNSMGELAALDRSTGEVVWSGGLEGLLIGPAVHDTLAVFCSESGEAAAWSHRGEQIWSRGFTTQPSAPSISGGKVYIGFSSGKVLALSLQTGETLWESSLDGVRGRTVVTRPSVVDDEFVVAGTCDGRVFSMDAATGSLNWVTEMENWVTVTPAVCDSIVYVSCDDSRIHLLHSSTGIPLDTLETGSYSGTPPVILDGVLYTGNADGDFSAIAGSVLDQLSSETDSSTTESE